MKFPLAMEASSMSLFSLLKTSTIFLRINSSNSFVIFHFYHAHFVDSDVVAFGLVLNNFFINIKS
jgi:hypothetical protein